jgi:hypothetical protein
MTTLLPSLSEEDPQVSSEGALDPLGLFAIADRLAVKLVPGVRERQSRIRFLTAMSVSLHICSGFGRDAIASDNVSEPWQIFEWYVVDGLVRSLKDSPETRRVPGVEKARNAIKNQVPLSARTYLKVPTVFGFHGVYRVLARELEIEDHGTLGETGYRLLETWSEEQDLPGFTGSEEGPGSRLRRRLTDAVEDALKPAAVARRGGWSGWDFFGKHLSPERIGPLEGQMIFQALADARTPMREEVLRFLVSPYGQRIWREAGNERVFHQALRAKASPDLARHLDTIGAYELFSRLAQDSFDDCLQHMSSGKEKVSLGDLAKLEYVKYACEAMPDVFEKAAGKLESAGEYAAFIEQFGSLGEMLPPDEWVSRLLDHHRSVQLRKPPAGKNPWFWRYQDGSASIRVSYRRDEGGRHDGSYVNAYRTSPLWSFASDLRKVGKVIHG